MITEVLKRDGHTVEPFDSARILNAIRKAFDAEEQHYVDNELESITTLVLQDLSKAYPDATRVGVEQIQDIVEKVLMDMKYFNIAKEYVLYRRSHQDARRLAADLAKRKADIWGAGIDRYTRDRQALTYGSELIGFFGKYLVAVSEGFLTDIRDSLVHINNLSEALFPMMQLQVEVEENMPACFGKLEEFGKDDCETCKERVICADQVNAAAVHASWEHEKGEQETR